MAEQACGNCRFFLGPASGDDAGLCRRFPPQVVDADGAHRPGGVALAPRVGADWWCGEWKRRDPGPPREDAEFPVE